MDLLLIRMASVIAVSAAYMLFDVFNRRNVPVLFVYATLAYGAVLTALYLDAMLILASAAIAAVVLGTGYFIYKAGQIGAADIAEFAALSLMIPLQTVPLATPGVMQFGIPFIVSILVGTGVVALAIVPLYYLPKAVRAGLKMSIRRSSGAKAVAIAAAYVAFAIALEWAYGISAAGVAVLAILAAGSAIIIAFEEQITHVMVRYVTPKQFDEGDIIAFNLMSKRSIDAAKRKVRGFGRLMTHGLIQEMRKKKVRQKFPVYKDALPLALPIFVAVVISLLIGNLFVLVLPAL